MRYYPRPVRLAASDSHLNAGQAPLNRIEMTDSQPSLPPIYAYFSRSKRPLPSPHPLVVFATFVGMGAGVVLGMSAFVAMTLREARDERLLLSVVRAVGDSYVEDLPRAQLVDNAIRGVLAGLDDHSMLLDERDLSTLQEETSGRFGGIGLVLALVDGYVTVVELLFDTPAARAGIVVGDRVIEVDHVSLKGRTLRQTVDDLRGEPGTDVHLRIRRTTEPAPLDFDLVRDAIALPSVTSRALAPGYGYAKIRRFNETTGDELEAAVAKLADEQPLQGFAIDLRGNFGGLLKASVSVADAFLEDGLIVYTESRTARATQRHEAGGGDLLDGAPLAVLIDADSASAAEVVAAALQDNQRAVVLGEASYGKGSVQSVMYFQKRRALKLTTARYFTPAGASIEDVGVTPDIDVPANADESADAYEKRLLERTLAALKS